MLDHETKPTLTVTLTATDPSEATDTITVTIHVTDVDEAPKITEGGLAVSGPMNPDYPENGTDAVGTYTAPAPRLPRPSGRWRATTPATSEWRVPARASCSSSGAPLTTRCQWIWAGTTATRSP